jgi:hypothetical protein
MAPGLDDTPFQVSMAMVTLIVSLSLVLIVMHSRSLHRKMLVASTELAILESLPFRTCGPLLLSMSGVAKRSFKDVFGITYKKWEPLSVPLQVGK